MKEFIIKQIDKSLAKYLVFGTTSESPLFQLLEIQDAIEISNGDRIIFDQLLQTGDANNRFIVMTFGDGSFDYSSAENIDGKVIDAEIRAFGCNFLRSNTLALKYSILMSHQKEFILNGGNI